MRKHAWSLVTLIAALALAGCGGGDNSSSFAGTASSSSSGGSSSGTTTLTYSMGNGTGSAFINGAIGLSSSSLSAGGNASLGVTIVDQTGTLYSGTPIAVTFNSPCIAQGLAAVAASGTSTAGTTANTVTTTDGNISATYTAQGCSPSDVITATATVGGSDLSATATISIAAATAGSIQFVSATPTTIGLKGTGLNETSEVVFKVLDSAGSASPGTKVTFSLNTTVGGLSLSQATDTSGADGTVRTVVSSGTQHTTVRVTATIASPALSTQSSVLTVTTGLPASNAFSISVGSPSYATTGLACSNVEAYGVDGVTVPITVRLADRYNNPAPDGTAVTFTTDAGHIVGSCQTPSAPGAADGTCSATWTSANPRPALSDDSPPLRGAGRGQILATAIGEESFTDVNGNGFWDSGEPFVHLGEPYRDDNENGQYDSGEYFLDFNQNGVWDAPSAPSATDFKGITCTGSAPGSTCSTSTLAIGVSHLIIMSSSAARITEGATPGFGGSGTSLTIATGGSGSVTFNVMDTNGNAMPAGTTITVIADSTIGTVAGTGVGFTVGCDAGTGGQSLSVNFTAGTTPATGNLTIQVTTPGTKTLSQLPIAVTVQ